MNSGLQTFDSAGNLLYEATSRGFRLKGSFEHPPISGRQDRTGVIQVDKHPSEKLIVYSNLVSPPDPYRRDYSYILVNFTDAGHIEWRFHVPGWGTHSFELVYGVV